MSFVLPFDTALALFSHWGSRHPQAPYFWIVQTKTSHQPTPAAYAELQEAFEFFNQALYQGAASRTHRSGQYQALKGVFRG